MKIPHISSGNASQLFNLEKLFLDKQHVIEKWFLSKFVEHNPPFYGSVDIRNSGVKVAPVDMNLYPGGFNNIHSKFIPIMLQSIICWFVTNCSSMAKVLFIPENHTRNKFYLDNVYALYNSLYQIGIDIRVGSFDPEVKDVTRVELSSARDLVYHPLKKIGDRVVTIDGFDPDIILLNNDLSSGCPVILQNITQKVIPPVNAGWYMRKKSQFFTQFSRVVDEFSNLIGIDPWKIDPYFDTCTNIDFASKVGIEELAKKVDAMIEKIKLKYIQYSINYDPYVIVKADNGTYGMGIMVVKSGQDILDINRKSRNKMDVIKDGTKVHDVIIQEGIHTIEHVDNEIAEPVVYMVDRFVIGGFYRIHPDKGITDNLNSVGMKFSSLPFMAPCVASQTNDPDCPRNRFYMYGVISRLTLIAASMELKIYK